jgi:hypothetical protein
MPKSRSRKRPDTRPPRRPLPDLDPSVGATDTDEDVSLIVATDGEGNRHAVVLPRSISRLSEHQTFYVKALQRNAIQMEGLRQALDTLVDEARDEGVSWSAIGWSLGTTGEAARQRWGDFDTATEPRRRR